MKKGRICDNNEVSKLLGKRKESTTKSKGKDGKDGNKSKKKRSRKVTIRRAATESVSEDFRFLMKPPDEGNDEDLDDADETSLDKKPNAKPDTKLDK